MSVCEKCGLEKELTRHGTCFKCHVGGISVPKRGGCKSCRSSESIIAEHRVSQNITVNSTAPLSE